MFPRWISNSRAEPFGKVRWCHQWFPARKGLACLWKSSSSGSNNFPIYFPLCPPPFPSHSHPPLWSECWGIRFDMGLGEVSPPSWNSFPSMTLQPHVKTTDRITHCRAWCPVPHFPPAQPLIQYQRIFLSPDTESPDYISKLTELFLTCLPTVIESFLSCWPSRWDVDLKYPIWKSAFLDHFWCQSSEAGSPGSWLRDGRQQVSMQNVYQGVISDSYWGWRDKAVLSF